MTLLYYNLCNSEGCYNEVFTMYYYEGSSRKIKQDMSHVMRKPTFSYAKTKTQISLR